MEQHQGAILRQICMRAPENPNLEASSNQFMVDGDHARRCVRPVPVEYVTAHFQCQTKLWNLWEKARSLLFEVKVTYNLSSFVLDSFVIQSWFKVKHYSLALRPSIGNDTTDIGVQCKLYIWSVEVDLCLVLRTWIITPSHSSTQHLLEHWNNGTKVKFEWYPGWHSYGL